MAGAAEARNGQYFGQQAARACAVITLVFQLSSPAFAQPSAATMHAVQAAEERLATIAHRLATRSTEQCGETEWRVGVALHAASQYSATQAGLIERAFGLESGSAVLALAADGPAAYGGVRANDRLLAIDGVALDSGFPRGSFAEVEAATSLLERQMVDAVAIVDIERDGRRLSLEIRGERGCASRFQLALNNDLRAAADGQTVQISSGLIEFVADDHELAASIAHELAHNILRHRARLAAAGMRRGFLQRFGRSGRLSRAAELEADRLGAVLMQNAGYDPEAAIRYLQRVARRRGYADGGTHPRLGERIAAIRGAIGTLARSRRPQVESSQRSSPSRPIAVSRPDR